MQDLQRYDSVTYTRTNGEVVLGSVTLVKYKQKAVYIREERTGNIVAAPLDRVNKI